MAYMKESDTAIWLCGGNGESIGYVGGVAATWFGPAELMPGMQYEHAREGEVFECLDGTEHICRADGWQEVWAK